MLHRAALRGSRRCTLRRECLEETGLEARVEHEIGNRNRPVTGTTWSTWLHTCYVDGGADTTLGGAGRAGVRPDVYYSVRRYLHMRFLRPAVQ